MRKKIYRKMLIIAAMIACVLSGIIYSEEYKTENKISGQTTNVAEIQNDMVYLGGMPIGIYMDTDGVLVIGTEKIQGMDKLYHDPASHIVKSGDYITAVNHFKIKDKRALIKMIKKNEDKKMILSLRRNHKIIDVKISPVKVSDKKYQLGIWVRDNMQGLGTITYIDSQNHFAALGHGIHDIDTNELLEISNGIIYKTSIRSIFKSKAGAPGSMEGIIVYNHYNELGNINDNTETGIFGTVTNVEPLLENKIPIQIASKNEIKTGSATVRCQVDGSVKEYKIKIKKLDFSGHEINKGMTLEVTDPELLNITGGIVQGMSGSPIIQNGKLIGAITHVFIKDAKKGYGIFIQNMRNINSY